MSHMTAMSSACDALILISSHRADLDFDKGYLNKVVTPEGCDFVAEVKSERNSLNKTEKTSGKQEERGNSFGCTKKQEDEGR